MNTGPGYLHVCSECEKPVRRRQGFPTSDWGHVDPHAGLDCENARGDREWTPLTIFDELDPDVIRGREGEAMADELFGEPRVFTPKQTTNWGKEPEHDRP